MAQKHARCIIADWTLSCIKKIVGIFVKHAKFHKCLKS